MRIVGRLRYGQCILNMFNNLTAIESARDGLSMGLALKHSIDPVL